jgi:predicted DsbA family dithiol-disulfide isomerase
MAVESAHVTSIIIEASEYPDLVQRYRVSGVPKTIVNGRVEIMGAQPEETFVRNAIGAAASPPTGSNLVL